MALNLTHYESIYANKKQRAIEIAESLIGHVATSGACVGDTVCLEKETIRMPKVALESVLEIVNSIMFSSGYYSDYKIKVKTKHTFIVTHKVLRMTAEEQSHLIQ